MRSFALHSDCPEGKAIRLSLVEVRLHLLLLHCLLRARRFQQLIRVFPAEGSEHAFQVVVIGIRVQISIDFEKSVDIVDEIVDFVLLPVSLGLHHQPDHRVCHLRPYYCDQGRDL